MGSYNTFAQFYDRLTENVDYKVRSSYISNFFSRYGKGGGRVLDLACGTGTIAEHLSHEGYQVIGLDISENMLSVAASKGISNAFFIKGDMRSFSLPEGVDCCVSSLDSINHLDTIEDWKKCFHSVYHALNEGGIFIFDINTVYKHDIVLADNAFVFDEEEFFLAWDNELCAEHKVRILLDFFVSNGINYDRYSEEFTETAFEVAEVQNALDPYFEILHIYDDLSELPPRKDSERLYFICKRK